jgi:hypothetical protein
VRRAGQAYVDVVTDRGGVFDLHVGPTPIPTPSATLTSEQREEYIDQVVTSLLEFKLRGEQQQAEMEEQLLRMEEAKVDYEAAERPWNACIGDATYT